MRLAALLLSPAGFLAFNENLNDFMLRPRCLPAILRHAAWRVKNLLRWSVRAARRADWPALFWYAAARAAGFLRLQAGRASALPAEAAQPGISVVIPSRNGRELLAAQLAGIARDLALFPSEIIVVDNGSQDGTADWLRDWRMWDRRTVFVVCQSAPAGATDHGKRWSVHRSAPDGSLLRASLFRHGREPRHRPRPLLARLPPQ